MPITQEEQLQRDGAVMLTKQEFEALAPALAGQSKPRDSWDDYVFPVALIGAGAFLLWLLFGRGEGLGFGKKGIDDGQTSYTGSKGKLFYRVAGANAMTADDGTIDDVDKAIAKAKAIDGSLVVVIPGNVREGDWQDIRSKLDASSVKYFLYQPMK